MTDNGGKDYVDEKISNIEVQMEDIEQQLGLRDLVTNPEVERLLSLTESDLEKMTAEECAHAKYILLQHSLVVQKKVNRATAIKNWCEQCITVILAKNIADVDQFMTYELKRATIVKNNSYGERLREISLEQQQTIDSLNFIAQAISNLATSFNTIYSSKRKVEHEYS
jgi:hypothetical protein